MDNEARDKWVAQEKYDIEQAKAKLASASRDDSDGFLGPVLGALLLGYAIYSAYFSIVEYFSEILTRYNAPLNVLTFGSHFLTVASFLGASASVYFVGKIIASNFVQKTTNVVLSIAGAAAGLFLFVAAVDIFFSDFNYGAYVFIGVFVFVFLGYKKPKPIIFLMIISWMYLIYTNPTV